VYTDTNKFAKNKLKLHLTLLLQTTGLTSN